MLGPRKRLDNGRRGRRTNRDPEGLVLRSRNRRIGRRRNSVRARIGNPRYSDVGNANWRRRDRLRRVRRRQLRRLFRSDRAVVDQGDGQLLLVACAFCNLRCRAQVWRGRAQQNRHGDRSSEAGEQDNLALHLDSVYAPIGPSTRRPSVHLLQNSSEPCIWP